MALRAVEPLSAAGGADGDLGVEDVFAGEDFSLVVGRLLERTCVPHFDCCHGLMVFYVPPRTRLIFLHGGVFVMKPAFQGRAIRLGGYDAGRNRGCVDLGKRET